MRKPLRTIIVFTLAILLVISGWNILHTKYQVTPALDVWALSVGQGESVFLHEASGQKILFDGGPNSDVLSELSSIMPFWDHTLDLIIVSHNHADHLDGMIAVLDHYTVREAWISGAIQDSDDYRTWRRELKEKNIPTKIMYAGQTEQFGTIQIQTIHPINSEEGITPKDQHEATIVTKITYQKNSILLTGDLDENQETDIMTHCRAPTCSLQSDILQIPHHGSKTGLLPAFLSAVNPKVAFISVGQHNLYHHPAPTTTKKLDTAHIAFFRTDLDGQVHFVLFGDHISYEKVAGSTPR